MNLQKNYELRLAAQELGESLKKIPQHRVGKINAICNNPGIDTLTIGGRGGRYFGMQA